MLDDNVPNSEDEVFYGDGKEKGEEEDDDDGMEDVHPAAIKLEAILPDNYDEDAATSTAMAASLADEEAKAKLSWP
jgi:hypothetical protein